ncbi:MAG TPA: SRPBCC domain-containing protein [Gammaproteobacteria bacterium]|nr:SRPBCC domain-containing protein [Gammaproteobacteria bacterium]
MNHIETRSVIVERDLAHPPEKVWRALTISELMAEWMLPNDFQPAVGHKFSLRTQPVGGWDGVVAGEVLEVEPPARLAYRWGVGDAATGINTVVIWTLTATRTGTHLRMEQTGFRPEQERNYQGARYGWSKFFGGLEQVLMRID